MAGKEKRSTQAEPLKEEPVVTPEPVQHAPLEEELMSTEEEGTGYLDDLMSTAPIDTMGPPAPPSTPAAPPDAPVVDPEEQARLAAEAQARVEAEQAAADRKLAEDIFADLDDAMGVGAFDLTDADKAQELLAGRSPSEMAAIRQYYQEQTGRTLESDVAGQFKGVAENEMMANVISGMSLRDQIEHYETSGSMENLIKGATPEQLAELAQDPSVLDTLRDKMDPQALMEARSELFPDQKVDAVRERIEAANGYVDDNEGAVMAAMQTLSLDERREFLANHGDSLSFLSAAERGRVERMVESEAVALEMRMIQATKGGGTDDDALPSLLADTGRLVTEQRALEARLASGDQLSEDDKAQIEARLAELGDINALLTPDRNADGSLKDGSFLQRLEGDVGDDQLHGFMGQMGVAQSEVSKQKVLDAIGFFNHDERGVEEAFADIPADQRMALWNDPHVAEAIGKMDEDERAIVASFRDNDVAAMSASRIDDANGWAAQDEAAIVSAVMDMNDADRLEFMSTPQFRESFFRMNPLERQVLLEAVDSGSISLDAAVEAGTTGLGTNKELIELAAQRKSVEDTLAVRQGYVLAQEGIEPKTPEEAAALAAYREMASQLEGDMDGDEYQRTMDKVLGHTGPQTDAYTGQTIEGPSSAEVERSTAEGRMTASLLMDARADEKMGPDGDGGGGLAAVFSDTDETAIQAHQSQKAAHYEALFDGEVTEVELQGHEALSEAFGEDYEAMVQAQNAITDAVATGVSLATAIAVTLATSGAAGPVVAAFMTQHATLISGATTLATTLGTKELMGGARYDSFGEAGATDLAMSVMDAGIGHYTRAAGTAVRDKVGAASNLVSAGTEEVSGAMIREGAGSVVRHEATGLALETTVDSLGSGVLSSVARDLTSEEFYQGDFGDSMLDMGSHAVEAVPGALQSAVIQTGMKGIATGVLTKQLNGTMDRLEAGSIPKAEVEAMDMTTLSALGQAQIFLDAGKPERAGEVLGSLKHLTDDQKAAYAKALSGQVEAEAPVQAPQVQTPEVEAEKPTDLDEPEQKSELALEDDLDETKKTDAEDVDSDAVESAQGRLPNQNGTPESARATPKPGDPVDTFSTNPEAVNVTPENFAERFGKNMDPAEVEVISEALGDVQSRLREADALVLENTGGLNPRDGAPNRYGEVVTQRNDCMERNGFVNDMLQSNPNVESYLVNAESSDHHYIIFRAKGKDQWFMMDHAADQYEMNMKSGDVGTVLMPLGKDVNVNAATGSVGIAQPDTTHAYNSDLRFRNSWIDADGNRQSMDPVASPYGQSDNLRISEGHSERQRGFFNTSAQSDLDALEAIKKRDFGAPAPQAPEVPKAAAVPEVEAPKPTAVAEVEAPKGGHVDEGNTIEWDGEPLEFEMTPKADEGTIEWDPTPVAKADEGNTIEWDPTPVAKADDDMSIDWDPTLGAADTESLELELPDLDLSTVDADPEFKLTPEIQAALDPNRVADNNSTKPASLINSPELTSDERLFSAQKRVEAALDSGLDGPMADYLTKNYDNVDVLESVLDTHDTQFSSAARAHLPAITEAGVPRHYLDGMKSESVELVGEAHRAMANGDMDGAIDALGRAGLKGGEHDVVLAKLMEHNLGPDALAGNEQLATLAAFADTQNPGFTMDAELAGRNAKKLVSNRNEKVLREVLATEAPWDMKAADRAQFYAKHMRDTLPADHPGQALSDAELLGQLLYTSTMNSKIMDPMRTLDPDDLGEMLPIIQSATSAVNNMPEANETTRRRFKSSTGEDVTSMLQPGKVYTDNAFMSQSVQPDVTKFGNAYVLDIEQSSGSMVDDLSAYGQYFGQYDATEGEVLSRPGNRVEILSSVERDGTVYLTGRELDYIQKSTKAPQPDVAPAAGPAIDPTVVREDIQPAVKAMFEAGPNRWAPTGIDPEGEHLFQRGLSGNYVTSHDGLPETREWLKGAATDDRSFVSVFDDISQSEQFMNDTNNTYSSPMSIRGKANLGDLGDGRTGSLPPGSSMDNVSDIGLFENSTKRRKWAEEYFNLFTELSDAGMTIDPESRGAAFVNDVKSVMDTREYIDVPSFYDPNKTMKQMSNMDAYEAKMLELLARYRDE